MGDTDKAYIGIRPCGCVTFVMVAGYESPSEEKQALVDQMADGGTVEVTTVAKARGRLTFDCNHIPARLPKEERESKAADLLSEAPQ